MPETTEELSQKPEVRQELARAGDTKAVDQIKAETKDKFWFLAQGLLLLGCAPIKKLLAALNAAPDKVIFPGGANC